MIFRKWGPYTGGSHLVENLGMNNFMKLQEEKGGHNKVLILIIC